MCRFVGVWEYNEGAMEVHKMIGIVQSSQDAASGTYGSFCKWMKAN